MPNHFHFLIKTDNNVNGKNISNAIAIILRSYSQAINKQQNRTGSLFQQKTKAKCLETSALNYPFVCFNYIHQNPLTAGIVKKLEDWEFSSFRDYAGLRNGTLCDKEIAYQLFDLPRNALEFYKLSYIIIPYRVIENLY